MRYDLSQWNSAYQSAPAAREGGWRTEVPDGNYQARVERVVIKETKSGKLTLEWELVILGPKSAGRKLWRNNFLESDDNIKFLKQDLYTCGVTLNHINDLNDESTLRKLIGVALEITKKTKGEYSNVYLNRRIELGGPVPSAPKFGAPVEYDDEIPF